MHRKAFRYRLTSGPRESSLRQILGANTPPVMQSQGHQGEGGEGREAGKDGDKCKVVITKLAAASQNKRASCSVTPEVSRKTIWSQGTWNSPGGGEERSHLFVVLSCLLSQPMGHHNPPKLQDILSTSSGKTESHVEIWDYP